MPHRVFLSSTFTDLAEYRKTVQDAIRQLGAVDVSMEHFGARDERPMHECVRLVQKESDLFVGIYAHRYGYVPDGADVSISEMEYKAASDASLPRFIYVVDDNQPWLPAQIDTPRERELVEHTLQAYPDRRDVLNSFRTWARMGCRYRITCPDQRQRRVQATVSEGIMLRISPSPTVRWAGGALGTLQGSIQSLLGRRTTKRRDQRARELRERESPESIPEL
jgi:hypothetical protein